MGGSRMTISQRDKMLHYLIDHPNLINSKISATCTKKDIDEMWRELSEILNGMTGCEKIPREWKKSWIDIRTKLRVKAAKRSSMEDPSIPTEETRLSILEERIIHLIGEREPVIPRERKSIPQEPAPSSAFPFRQHKVEVVEEIDESASNSRDWEDKIDTIRKLQEDSSIIFQRNIDTLYAPISRVADAMEKINKTLERIANSLEKR